VKAVFEIASFRGRRPRKVAISFSRFPRISGHDSVVAPEGSCLHRARMQRRGWRTVPNRLRSEHALISAPYGAIAADPLSWRCLPSLRERAAVASCCRHIDRQGSSDLEPVASASQQPRGYMSAAASDPALKINDAPACERLLTATGGAFRSMTWQSENARAFCPA
jgi:hypothetical protein